MFRYSLRTALVLVTLLCVAFGWWVVRAERQRAAVAAVREAGGRVRYTYEVASDGSWIDNAQSRPWAPAWLLTTFGEDLFVTVDGVYFGRPEIDDDAIERLVPKLRRMPNLRWLELRDSSITDAALARIAELTQLERLFLRSSGGDSATRTHITDRGLAQLDTLRALHHLSLGECQIDGSAFAHLSALRRLEELDLRDTQFNDAAAAQLPQFPRLRYLNLWKTPITDAATPHIAQLKRLEELYFWDNILTDASAVELATLPRLQVLDLHGSGITDRGVEHLQSLSELTELRLPETKIQNPPIASFTKLRRLHIGWTNASDDLLNQASQLTELQELDCCECERITDTGIKHLEKSKSLERLFFPARRTISPAAIQSLQQAKPKLTINF